jgi:hypothetical protein
MQEAATPTETEKWERPNSCMSSVRRDGVLLDEGRRSKKARTCLANRSDRALHNQRGMKKLELKGRNQIKQP